ncbi:MAG: sensor domain-containing diguanylate cyclase [Bryobacteraceae bacterium]
MTDVERQLSEMAALARIGNWEFDLMNDQIRWSEETFRIFGLEPGAHEPDFADILLSIHPEDAPLFDRAIHRAVTAGESYRLDLRIRCPNGGQKHIHAQGSPVCDPDRRVARIIGTVLDITERKLAEQKLLADATYDALTGLVNRRALYEKLEGSIQTAKRKDTPLVVCVSDIDKFKGVNDTFGHAAGDEVLITYARLLRDGTRESDIPARLGGDEFCIVFPRATAPQAVVCLERIRQRFQDMEFRGASNSYSVTATFGVAQWTEGMTVKELVEAADQALYRAKEHGRNCVWTGAVPS